MSTKIQKLIKKNKITQETLDELVYEAAEINGCNQANTTNNKAKQENHLADAETKAAEINNGGMAAQIAYLTKEYGEETLAKMLLEAISSQEPTYPPGTAVVVTNVASAHYCHTGTVTGPGKKGRGWYVQFPGKNKPVYIPFGLRRAKTD